MITKTFEYKGQMINYYNKVANNANISFCYMSYEQGVGYIVRYMYK